MGVCLVWSLLKFTKMKCCSSIPSTMRQCIASPLHINPSKVKMLGTQNSSSWHVSDIDFCEQQHCCILFWSYFWINAKFRSKHYVLCILQLDLISPAYAHLLTVSEWLNFSICLWGRCTSLVWIIPFNCFIQKFIFGGRCKDYLILI